MGKNQNEQRHLQLVGQHGGSSSRGGNRAGGGASSSSQICCERCSMGLRRLSAEFSFRCVVVLLLGLAVFVSAVFWVLPLRRARPGFDASHVVKSSATVQASFKLEKPVSEIVMHIGRLEYDIYGEIGVTDTKVAVLSVHQSGSSNYTDVVFGVLSNPISLPINQVSLSVLRSYLIDLFVKQSNLTLTASLFGQSSEFQILKFPGGITVNPMQTIWQTPQILFNFSLYHSMSEIQENFVDFKAQLRYGLHLRPYENVYVQITNMEGSTIDPLVTVEASVTSDFGNLQMQRLKQLAQIISGSPAENLGLDNSVFGRVKSVSLSSYLKGTLHSGPPTPSPAPSPEFNKPSSSPYFAPSSYAPIPSPHSQPLPPCSKCEISLFDGRPYGSVWRNLRLIPSLPSHCTCSVAPAPAPFHPGPSQTPTSLPPTPASHSPYLAPTSERSPSSSQAPTSYIASPPVQERRHGEGAVSPSAAPLYSSKSEPSYHMGKLLVFCTILFNLLWWTRLEVH